MKFFSQLFDSPDEIVIAHGRVVLAAFSLLAITIDPTEPSELSLTVAAALMLYAVYAVAMLAALHWRIMDSNHAGLVHAIDLTVLTMLLLLTEGLSSPFLVFFTFALLAAALRWDWRGIVLTMAALVALAGAAAFVDFAAQQRLSSVNEWLIRTAYLIVIGTILTYTSAHREHERKRLLALAQWPATVPFTADERIGPLTEALRQAADVLDASAAFAVWDEGDGRRRGTYVRDGACQFFRDLGPDRITVAPELERLAFSRTLPDLTKVNLIHGSARPMKDVLRGDLVAELGIADFSSSDFQGLAVTGRLFILGNIRPSDHHLPTTRILADRFGADLDRLIFTERIAKDAVLRERSAIMRDLHDGLLQGLTAARMHLEVLPTNEEQTRAQLKTVHELLRFEQRRLREFVDAMHVSNNANVGIEILRPMMEESARLWGCKISLNLEPKLTVIPRKTATQLSLMLAEAAANAVRHGEASTIEVDVRSERGLLNIEVRDDGRGFPELAKDVGSKELPDTQLPRSLSARVRELGGRMRVVTSRSGTVLCFELPS